MSNLPIKYFIVEVNLTSILPVFVVIRVMLDTYSRDLVRYTYLRGID